LTPTSGPQPPGPPNQPSGDDASPDDRGGSNSAAADGQGPSDQAGPAGARFGASGHLGGSEQDRQPWPEPAERPWNAKAKELLALIDQLAPSSLEDQELALGLIRQLVEQNRRSTMEGRREDGDAPGP
jgi:hypothetical protein